ncbi:hypothetical protein KKA69_02145 [Patescibacteria group bacterium]|nr:hypothetical protein [Patescibacteria group bacterium]
MKDFLYFFILGTNHSLSKIDVVNTLAKRGIDFGIIAASEEALLIDSHNELELNSLMLELGSVIKAGRIFNKEPFGDFSEKISEISKSKEFKEFFLTEERISYRFGISVYGAGGAFKSLNQTFYQVPASLRQIKSLLEEEGFNVNYLPHKERELSSVAVKENELLSAGFEMVLLVSKEGIFLGKTEVIQDYESYSLRDYGRPARDPKAGMIPPKLAKMMINLSGKEKNDLFLDPFCGSGTMLQEMVLLGYKNLIGSDSSEKSINDARLNLGWLFEKYNLKKNDYKIEIFQADVAKISSKVNFRTVKAIVTEPYLGSPSARSFDLGKIKKEVRKLEELYLKAFSEFRKILKDDGIIVIIFPVFRFKNEFFNLEILNSLEKMGFGKRDYLFKKPEGWEHLNLNLTERNSVIFFRPGQTVSREILVFKKI